MTAKPDHMEAIYTAPEIEALFVQNAAALSIFHADGLSDGAIELTHPLFAGDDLTYTVEILDGDMPAHGGPSSLFIDVVGRPPSPMSVAGVACREDRRQADRLAPPLAPGHAASTRGCGTAVDRV